MALTEDTQDRLLDVAHESEDQMFADLFENSNESVQDVLAFLDEFDVPHLRERFEDWCDEDEETPGVEADEERFLSPAGCSRWHRRKGLVTNQDPDKVYDAEEPYSSISCCSREACIKRTQRQVAGQTNRRAEFYDDAERRAKKAEG